MDLFPSCRKGLAFVMPVLVCLWPLAVYVCVFMSVCNKVSSILLRHLSREGGSCEFLVANIHNGWGVGEPTLWRECGAYTTVYLLHCSGLLASPIEFISSRHSHAPVSGRVSGINYSPHTAVGLKVIFVLSVSYFPL